MFDQTVSAALNHLLAQEPWARERLGRFAGRAARIDLPVAGLILRVGDDGLVAPAPDGEEPAVQITVLPDALGAWLRGGKEAAMGQVRLAGDAEFAQLISSLAQQLRWEAEEDLARLIGDGPAHAVAGAARQFGAQVRDAGQRLAGNLVEYLVHEQPTLVDRAAQTAFAASVATLRDDLARLEKRMARLDAKMGER